MRRLEDIVRQMETGELSLNESMAAFEEAVRLSRFCSSALEDAKQRVRALIAREDGTVIDRPFADNDAT